MPAQCKKIDRIEVCTTSTDVCSEGAITNSGDVARICRELAVCNLLQEEVWVLCLNPQGFVVAYAQVTKGTTDQSMVVAGDVLRIVLAAGVRNFILVHNHPSGATLPSQDDRVLTQRMSEAARAVGFTMLDHVIVAEHGHFSFRDDGGLR